MQIPTLTNPVSDLAKVRNSTPEARAMTDDEINQILDLEEFFLRLDFGVYSTEPAADALVERALLAGFASFRKQVAQMTAETVGVDSYSITVGEVSWPRMVGLFLAPISDPEQLSGVSDLVELRRDDDPVRGAVPGSFNRETLRALGLRA